jgi:hypothetical protein
MDAWTLVSGVDTSRAEAAFCSCVPPWRGGPLSGRICKLDEHKLGVATVGESGVVLVCDAPSGWGAGSQVGEAASS